VRTPSGWTGDSFGVATSGTSVHRWHGSQGPTHHLIDPATRRPAVTDVVQATVVAGTAGLAEALAKAAVIRGSHDGLELLDRAGAWAALLLLQDGHLLATPGTARWLD
jgi:thiamine biosynthesis lipoprotein